MIELFLFGELRKDIRTKIQCQKGVGLAIGQ